MNDNFFSLKSQSDKVFFSSRTHAASMRRDLEIHLQTSPLTLTIDFSDTQMTQSFADELIGVLVYRFGSQLLARIKFKGCTEESKKILSFVVTQRLVDRDNVADMSNSHYAHYQEQIKAVAC